ncbi:CAP domain-containing protein [Streptomyces tritici]|uniref:CAP domain-containing protein n=1 Tax=Streptomyces tritici TaxID=2054410 RepID=UPI003AEF752D
MEQHDADNGVRAAVRRRGRRALAVAGLLALIGWAALTAAGPSAPPDRSGVPAAGPRARGAGAEPLSGTAERYAEQLVALVNAERMRAGCDPLRPSGALRAAAQRHADDMAARGYYEHRDPDGADGGDRITAAGYDWRAWGENIHRGPRSPAHAMRDWMDSAAHRRNVVNCAFRDLGVGVNLRSNGPWWVQVFGTRG